MFANLAARSLLRWAFIVEGGMFLAALVIGWLIKINPLQSIVHQPAWTNWQALGGGLAAGSILFGLGCTLDFLPWEVLRRFGRFMQEQVVPLFTDSAWWELALISILAGIGEETLFRGLIQAGIATCLHDPWGWLVAVAIASLFFGCCHAMNWTYFILATIMGFFFGGLLLWCENLLACMMAHAWYDFLMLLFLVSQHRKRLAAPRTDELATS